MKIDDLKIGDPVYAVGPGHHSQNGPTDLCVYSTVVKNIRLDGSYSASATPEDLASATRVIELNDDRPLLGFPKWIYNDYEVGIHIHRSAAAALRVFAARAHALAQEAAIKQGRHEEASRWALAQLAEVGQ